VGEKRKGNTCDKATKGTVRRETSTPCEGRSTGKKVKEDRKRRGNMYGQAMRGIARVEEEFSSKVKEESGGALHQEGTRRSTTTGVRIVHERSDSNVCAVQKMWRKEMSCEGK